MSSKYPIVLSKKIVLVLLELGFYKVGQKGSHTKYKSEITNKICIVSIYYEIARGTLKSILD